MSKKTTTVDMDKIDGHPIVDQFLVISRSVQSLAVLRDGIRLASSEMELFSWQDIADLLLEHVVHDIDDALHEMGKTCDGLPYDPVKMSPYSLLRGSHCDCNIRQRNRLTD